MLKKRGFFIVLLIIFTATNIFIYFNRDKGFEFIAYKSSKGINQPPGSRDKWTKKDRVLSKEYLLKAASLLKTELRSDSFSTRRERTNALGNWLFSQFEPQLGPPEKQLNLLEPWEQFQYLKQHPDKKLWCGHIQEMFAFFATAKGFINRKIEVVPRDGSDFHEVNEVYLEDQGQWMMVDATRGIFPGIPASAYFDQMLARGTATDNYFNKDYFLRYYYLTDLETVYSPREKIKRYIFGTPWFEVYDPLSSRSNLLFRIKQFMLAGQLVLVILLIIFFVAGKARIYK